MSESEGHEGTDTGSTSGFSDLELEQCLSSDVFNHFEIVGNIGKGSYGSVFKTKSKTDKKLYAIKVIPLLSDQDEEKMNREVEVLSQLHHTNIVRYHTSWHLKNDELCSRFGSNFACLCIQMEYCEQTLRDFIDNMSSIESKEERELEQKRILMEILDGVRYMHEQNVMHRDLNPKNIFLTKSGTVKIGDFGIARHSDLNLPYKVNSKTAIDDDKGLTSYIGTRLYCSPELLEGDKKYDKTIDYYSLGIIVFEIWYPFPPGTTEMEKSQIFAGIKSADVIFPESFEPDVMKEIVKGLMQHNPRKRMELETVAEMLLSMEEEATFTEDRSLTTRNLSPEFPKVAKSVGRLYFGAHGKPLIHKGCCLRLGSGRFVITPLSVVKKKNFPKFWSVSFGSKRKKFDLHSLKSNNPVWSSISLDIAILDLDTSNAGLEMKDLDANQKLYTFRNLKSTKALIEISERPIIPEDPSEDIIMEFESASTNKGAPVLYTSDNISFSVLGLIIGHIYENGIKVKNKTIVRNLRSVYESVDPIVPREIRMTLFSSSPFYKCHERLMQNIETYIENNSHQVKEKITI